MNRSDAGRAAARAGRDFEKQIEAALTVLEQQRHLAHWHHTEPAYRMIGRGRYMPTAAGFADYSGTLRGGFSFALECKSEGSPRFKRSRISPAQQQHLDAVAGAGGLACLALQLRDDKAGTRTAYLMLWREAPWQRARTAESLTAEALEDYRMPNVDPFNALTHRCAVCTTMIPRRGLHSWRGCPNCGEAVA